MDLFPLLMADNLQCATVESVNAPFDGVELAQIETAGAEHIEASLSLAYSVFRDRKRWLSVSERIDILNNAATMMSQQVNRIALAAAEEGGKPLVDSIVEVNRAIDGLHLCVETIRSEQGNVIPMNFNIGSSQRIAFTQKEPIGVVVAVSAFNHPLNLIVHQVAAAVAAGCPVIVKPAMDTPLSCWRFVKILHEAGLPIEYCQVLPIVDNDIASGLVSDKRVGFFSFIGSAKVGWMLRAMLAPGTRCALEHGGAAPAIVAEDADLNTAIPLLLKGGFYHAGQVCVSVQRVFVHESIALNLAKQLAEQGQALKVGDPTLESTDVGPLIRHNEVQRVHQWVSEAADSGGTVLSGGIPINDSCYPCTVIYNPPQNARVSQLEIFGPVICVYSYRNIDEAIALANALPVAFQASVFTQNINTAMRVYKNIDASTVMVNEHTAFRVDGMPFAGLRESGLGVGGIAHTIADMQIEKMAVIRSEEL